MNYKTYAKAVFEAFLEKKENDFEKFFENFISELKEKKRIKLLPKILREIKKYFEIAEKKNITEVVLKNKNDFEKFEDRMKEFQDKFDLENIKIVENKNIAGGFVLRNSKYIFDKSYKKGLLELYKKIVK